MMIGEESLVHGCLLVLKIQSAMDGVFENSWTKAPSSWREMAAMCSQGCLNDGKTLARSCSLKVLEEFWKWPRSPIFENE